MSVSVAIIILERNFTKEGLPMSIKVTQYPGKVMQYSGKVVRYATAWNQVRETAAAHPQHAVNTFAGQVYQRLCAQGYADKTVSTFIRCATTLAFDHLEHVVRVGQSLPKDVVEGERRGQYFDAATLAALQEILAAADFHSSEQILAVYYLLLTDSSMQPVLAADESDGENMVRQERNGGEDEIGPKQKGEKDVNMLRQRWMEGKDVDIAPQKQFSMVRDARYNQVAAMVTRIVDELRQQPCRYMDQGEAKAHNFWHYFVLQWHTGPYVGVEQAKEPVYKACLRAIDALPPAERQSLWQHFGFSLDPKPEDCPSQEIWAAFSITADLTSTFFQLVCDRAGAEYRAGRNGEA
jgi:hypothetical protein